MPIVGKPYTRASLGEIFKIPDISKTREGIVSRNGITILFVTLDKTQQENKSLHYNDFFQKDIFQWDSQTTQNSASPSIIKIMNGEADIHLFVRIFAKIGNITQNFIYCGRLQYASHVLNTSNPVHINYESLDYQENPNKELKEIYEWIPKKLSPFKLSDDAIVKIPRRKSRGQGFGLTGPQRKSVEIQAMLVAMDVLKKMGAVDIVDVSMNESRDYIAKIKGKEWTIEVKGTTSYIGEEFFMSTKEKRLHEKEQGSTALIFITGIILSEMPDGQPLATGGVAEALFPWIIEDWHFEPITYKVTLKNNLQGNIY
jgi:hypothetical protein